VSRRTDALCTWRDDQGDEHGTVYDGTACRNPVEPRSFAASSADGDFEVVLRCRDCAGCRNYERLVLRRRLFAWLSGTKEKLWVRQTSTRATAGPLTPIGTFGKSLGWVRSSPTGFVVIVGAAGGPGPAKVLPGGAGNSFRRLRLSGGPRALRALTRGMLMPRSELGRNKNRFYFRGMPPADHDVMRLELRGGIRKRHPSTRYGALAWKRGLSLYASNRSLVERLLPRTISRLIVNSRRVAASALSQAPDLVSGGRDASSLPVLPRWAADWLSTVLKKAAGARGP
jgi:hypothetical protein